MDEQTYHIPEQNMSRMDDLFSKLEKRAKKLNQPTPGYNILAENLVEKIDEDENKYYVKIYDVEVFGTTPKIAGWSFLAVLINEGVGNVINPLPSIDPVSIPAFYRTSGTICEHCGQPRNRKQTFLLFNQDSQEFKQVGSSCIVDFLGSITPEGIAQYAEFLSASLDEISNCESDFFPGGSSEMYYRPADYLSVAIAVIEDRGYTSKAKADYSIGKPSTADIVSNEFFNKPEYKDYVITEAHVEKAKKVWEWAQDYFSQEINRESDFGWSFYVITQKELLTSKDFGRVTYLPVVYAYEVEKMVKREKKLAESAGFVGNIGDKIQITGTVLVNKLISSNYHYSTYLVKIQDEAGHLFTWFASNELPQNSGDMITLKGTIKDHSEYRGEQSTVITRCKVIS